MNAPHSTSKPEPIYISRTQTLIADTEACGSPKGLRMHLQQYDTLLQERQVRAMTACAAAVGNVAIVTGFAPALVRASNYCFAAVSAEATARCSLAGAPAVGALLGVTGLTLAGYALHLNWNASLQFVTRMDGELEERFGHTLQPGEDARRVRGLMTRYSQLSDAQRRQVKDALFDAYLATKERPASA